ncbi:G-D-S-L family lipolytic protein [Flavobacterium sp. CS20]|uniref:G-D-S-L family lipolytic protein n=1 Tax=Flavobacterium sp. CS20 TaxID=2775246 RepID=UPI001B3A048C|nr:G-D-S-L family lipolytic protein [Flavobacterium sp. CS20]QTY26124.1 G-D-S-L family lipolytic protein [Flavobacterium sp. CS20]
MKIFKLYLLLFSAVFFISCEAEFDNAIEDNEVYDTGEADFSNFVSVGNSLTAGFADNALYREGQMNSFPNILAKQFALVGGGEFNQPLMADNLGGLLLNGNPIPGFDTRLVLSTLSGQPLPDNISGTPQTDIANVQQGPFNNMGVPGAKSFHLGLSGYGDISNVGTIANPYFVRFASSPSATVIEDAVAQNPSFFSLWIGNNDILGFASSGGVGVDQTGNLDPATYGSTDITDPNVFAQIYTGYVNALSANASGGVLYNIPDVTSIPFFTTVPRNAVPLDAQTADVLNQQFATYNQQILPGLVQFSLISAEEATQRQINFQAGQNFVTLTDESLTDISQFLLAPPFNLDPQTAGLLAQLRQATNEDLIPLTASGNIGNVLDEQGTLITGVTVPLGDESVLTVDEQMMINNARNAYNATIQSATQANGLAFVDVNALLQEAEVGIPYDGGTLSSTFVTGGAFSLDGVHLTPRGYALVANKSIEAINQTYGSTLPTVNIGDFRTIATSDNTDL